MIKMSEQAPGDLLVEKYLVEIAKSHNVLYQPDPNLSIRDPDFFFPSNNEHKNDGSSNGSAGGFSQPPMASEPSPMVNQQASYIGFHQTPAVLRSKNENKTEPKDFREEFSFPNVPDGNPGVGNLSSDYDDLTSRFERLKKNLLNKFCSIEKNGILIYLKKNYEEL
ncbi:IST1 -like protein [Brachionus plicatilis]|nr:IST1 -like protein [Brachionus plicatilis]